MKQVCKGPPGEPYCTVCWWSSLDWMTCGETQMEQCDGEGEIQMYMYDLWVPKCQCMRGMVCRSCVGWCGVEFGCTRPCWEAQATHGPLRGAHWLKTIGISVKWCDMCMSRSLSVRGALLQGWKRKDCMKKGRERRTVGWGGGTTKALVEDRDSNCNSLNYAGWEAGF